MYGLLTKCEVKIEGYRPRSFFCLRVAGQKKEANEQSLCRARSVVIKDLLYAVKNTVFFQKNSG